MIAASRLSLVLATVLASACGAPEPIAPPRDRRPPEAPPEPLPQHLDTQVTAYIGEFGRNWPSFRFHGVVLVARGPEIGVHRAFGLADLSLEVHNERTTRFRIGTMSAQLVAAATMLLVDRGKLSLDTKVADVLPQRGFDASMTLEHLLTHTSGIANFTELIWFDHNKRVAHSTETLLDMIARLPAEHPPGKELTPSNSNSIVAAAVIEAITGEPFDAFVRREILSPLQMVSTELGATSSQQALGLEFNEQEHLDPVHSVHPGAFGVAGGYLSTAADLLRFNRALAENTLLTEATRDRMLGRGAHESGFSWVTQPMHGSSVSGWTGLIDGINSAVLNVVEDGTVVVVLANTEVVSATQVAQDVLGMVYGDETPSYQEHRAIPIPLVDQASAVGHYVATAATARILQASGDPEQLDTMGAVDVAISPQWLLLAVPNYGVKRMHPLGKGRFFFKDVPRTTARFSRRTDGKQSLVLEQPNGTRLRYLRQDPAPTKSALAAR